MTKEVAIFGATGAQGAPVVEEALKAGLQVRAVARDAAKVAERHPTAEAYAATLDDKAALATVLTGVSAAFVHLPMPTDPEAPQRWLQNLIEVAHEVALPLLVYSTSGSTGERYPASAMISGNTAARDAILASGIPAIVLQPTIYLENLQIPAFLSNMASEGIVDYPPLSPEHRVSWTSHRDQAVVAAAALQRPDLAGKAFEIATPGAVTGGELAQLLSDWQGRALSFQPLTPESFGNRAEAALGAPGLSYVLSDLYGALNQVAPDQLAIDTDAIEATFGVTLSPLAAQIRQWSTVTA